MICIDPNRVLTRIAPERVPVLTEGEITKSTAKLTPGISSDKFDRERLLIAVPEGAIIFPSDLIRHLTIQANPKFKYNGVRYDYHL